MTEEAEVVETETVETVASRNYEAEARASGWVPEAEFKGEKRPAVFLDAETFVKRGEELTPFIRKENQKLKQQLDETKADFAKRIERMEKATAKAFEAEKRNHEAALERIKREQRAAVASGDEAEFDRLDKARTDLEKAAPKIEEPEKVDPKADLATRQAKWREDNTWFDEDFDLQDWAIRYSDFHGQKNPHLSFEQNMAAVTAEAKKRFPEKFGGKKSSGNGQSAVDAGSDFGAVFGGKGKKTGADLPAEAKAAGEKFVKQGLFKDLNAYAKEYFND